MHRRIKKLTQHHTAHKRWYQMLTHHIALASISLEYASKHCQSPRGVYVGSKITKLFVHRPLISLETLEVIFFSKYHYFSISQ